MAVSTVSSVPRAARIDRSTLLRCGATAAGLALALVALVRTVGLRFAPDLAAIPPFQWGALGASTIMAAAAATLVYALLSGRPHVTRAFLLVAVAVLVASFAPLLTVAPTISGMTTIGLVVLGGTHVAAAVGIVAPLIGRTS